MARRAKTARQARIVRHRRVRTKLSGTAERPRLAVFRSLHHIYAQVVDDSKGHTVAAASSIDPEIREARAGKSKREVAEVVGELVARRASQIGVGQVVFDRGGNRYHGRVKSLADAARKGGLVF